MAKKTKLDLQDLKDLKVPTSFMFLVGLVALIAFIGYTSFFIVPPNEQAVIKRFGKVVNVKNPGPHFKMPYPIETITSAKVTEIHRMEIGSKSSLSESQMLTGDENIVSIYFIVQYQIKDVVDYLFNLQDPESTIRLAAEASIREVAGKALIDDLLTTGKEKAQEETRQLMQTILDSYKAGVTVKVELKDIEPPSKKVLEAFQDVASAREDKNKYINEAQAYENQKIPMARGQAATIMHEAEGYKAIIIGRAEGEASRFLQVYESYKKTPNITKKRMYIEAMTNIVENSEVIVVDENLKDLNVFTGLEGFVRK